MPGALSSVLALHVQRVGFVSKACLLCFEVFPLSLLTLYAWKPRRYEDWYDADGGWGREKEGEVVTVGRLAGEGTTFAATKKNSNNQNRRVLNKRTV